MPSIQATLAAPENRLLPIFIAAGNILSPLHFLALGSYINITYRALYHALQQNGMVDEMRNHVITPLMSQFTGEIRQAAYNQFHTDLDLPNGALETFAEGAENLGGTIFGESQEQEGRRLQRNTTRYILNFVGFNPKAIVDDKALAELALKATAYVTTLVAFSLFTGFSALSILTGYALMNLNGTHMFTQLLNDGINYSIEKFDRQQLWNRITDLFSDQSATVGMF